MKYDFTKELRLKGLKITPPRLAILEVFLKSKKHESIKTLSKKLKNIDIVTIYRNINSFEEKGILRKVGLYNDSVAYELNLEHHHHIVCTKCNKIEEFKNCDIGSLVKKISLKSSQFKVIKDHSFKLFGICNSCIKNLKSMS